MPGNDHTNDLFVISHPRSPVAEACRAIRTSLRFAAPAEALRTILITSPGPAEGKTTVLANVGITLAQNAMKVLLVDADLRRPRLHKLFGLPSQPGLTNILAEGISHEETARDSQVEGLSVIPSGPIPPTPSELLGSSRMQDFLAVCRDSYDVVLVDSPPLITVTDATVMSPMVDGVIIVVKSRSTTVEALREARSILDRAGSHIIGAVLNAVTSDGRGYPRYYDYYYGHRHERA